MRTSRLLRAGVAGAVVILSLSGCALLPPLPIFWTPQPDPGPMQPASVEVEAGSCLGELDYDGDVTPRDELISCSVQHSADVIALVEWPGMTELLGAESTKLVWDEVSGTSPMRGLAVDYLAWASTACGDAWRSAIGWDRLNVAGTTASDLDLRPAAPFEVVAAVAEYGDFRAGDHRTRCVIDWFDPIAYDGIGPADLLTDEFPVVGRDCYTFEPQWGLEPIMCTFPHTDQALLTFEGLEGLGAEFVQPDGVLDEEQTLHVDNFCAAAVQATFGTVDARDHYIWGGPWGGPDWEALSGEPDPDASYPFACVVARNDGGSERGDVLSGLSKTSGDST